MNISDKTVLSAFINLRLILVPEMSDDITLRNARNCKKYYYKKKSENQSKRIVKKKKTNSEICRQYRQRKKLLAQQLQSKNKVIHTPSTSSLQMTFESQLITTGNVFIVVEKVDNGSNIITGDVCGNANPPMQVDTKDPTLTSTMSDSNSLEGPTINENLDIKEEYINEELLEEEELMAVDPLAI